jgi:hypothetical protein
MIEDDNTFLSTVVRALRILSRSQTARLNFLPEVSSASIFMIVKKRFEREFSRIARE